MTTTQLDVTVTAVPVAILPIPGWEAYFGVNDVNFHDLVFYIWIIRHGEEVMLVDAGLPVDEVERRALVEACQRIDDRSTFNSIRLIDEVLDEHGVDRASVTAVVITQTITYHTGGLVPGGFPNARLVLARAGVNEMLVDPPGHPPASMYFTEQGWAEVRLAATEGRLVVTDDPVEIRHGVVFEVTGGHHPGSAAVSVPMSDGTLTLLETAFFDRNVEEGLPIGIAEDAAACRAALRRYAARGDRVIALHDPANATRFASP